MQVSEDAMHLGPIVLAVSWVTQAMMKVQCVCVCGGGGLLRLHPVRLGN